MQLTRRTSCECSGAFLLIAITIAASSQKYAEAQAFTFDTVAISGEVAPGTTATFSSFDTPVINDAGRIAFFAELGGSGVTGSNDRGIFSASQGALSLIAREGDAVPTAGAGVNIGTLFYTGNVPASPAINVAGQTAFLGRLTGPGMTNSNDGAIFSHFGGASRLVARDDGLAPGTTPGVMYTELLDPALNGTGQSAFLAHLSGAPVGSTPDQGIFVETGGTVSLVARTRQIAPGIGGSVAFRSFGLPDLNNSGQTAFNASLTGGGVNSSNETAVYFGSAGALELIARAGNAVPGAGPGVNFSFVNAPMLNDAGHLAFRSILDGSGVGANNEALFLKSVGPLNMVVRKGDAAPGTAPGVLIGRMSTPLSLNNVGQIAFASELTGSGVTGFNDGAIFSTVGGALGLVVRSGNAAPGTGPDVAFRGFDAPMINDSGHVAFQGYLIGPSVNTANDQGIFAVGSSGTVELVVRHGDLFDVDPDPFVIDNRTIRFALIVSSVGGFNRTSSLNNANQIAMRIGFTDLTEGIFVATFAVPEPASLTLLAVGGLVLSRRRHR